MVVQWMVWRAQGERVMDCAGKSDATALSDDEQAPMITGTSVVRKRRGTRRFPPHFKTPRVDRRFRLRRVLLRGTFFPHPSTQ